MPRGEPLLPCPFCGVLPYIGYPLEVSKTYRIECVNIKCQVSVVGHDTTTEAAAIAAWNTRWRADDAT